MGGKIWQLIAGEEMFEPSKDPDRRKTAAETVAADTLNIACWFTPFVAVHNLAWLCKPLFMDPRDIRGPWEYVWNDVVIGTVGDDRFLLTIHGNFTISNPLALL